MRAVIYARISKDEQSKYSIDEQVVRCRKFLEDEGHEIVDIFVDNGYSSKTMNRPDLQRMLGNIKKKAFEIICVWNSDRLTRTTLDGLNMVTNMFRPNGIEFASVTEDIDTSTPDGMMMFTIRLSMAQREREKIAERVALGQQARAKEGKRNTSARPFGYIVTDDLRLEINEEEATWLRQIFEWYLSGWGRAKIARTLNEKEVPANRGGKWSEKVIGDIIGNPTFAGCVHYKPKKEKRIIVPNVHPAIITMEQWERANDIKRRRRDHDMNLSEYDFPFSTVLKCAVCGRSYHGKQKAEKKYRKRTFNYYRCSGKYRPIDPCDASDIVESKVVDMLFKQIDLYHAAKNETKRVDVNRIDTEKERKRIEKQLNDSKERRKKWAKAMADDKLDYETYSELVEEENNKTVALQKQLEELPQETAPHGKTAKDISDLLIYIRDNWHIMSAEDRKQFIQSNFRQIIIGKFGESWKILGIKPN